MYRVAKQKAEKTKVEMVYRNLPQTEQWNLVQHRGAPKGPREVWRANHRPSQLRRWLFIWLTTQFTQFRRTSECIHLSISVSSGLCRNSITRTWTWLDLVLCCNSRKDKYKQAFDATTNCMATQSVAFYWLMRPGFFGVSRTFLPCSQHLKNIHKGFFISTHFFLSHLLDTVT